MGVPALFRWLSKKYPKIVSDVKEEQPKFAPGANGDDDAVPVPVDMSGPNPNGEEFDALYLDMNGIVHPCTHPEGKPAPETEEDMMLEVFIYTERVVNMVRPRKLLMMAIDGVAPRAKMNQQRSRRFRAAQEARQKEEEMEKALAEWRGKGLEVREDGGEKKKSWDRNAITPGTPFMDLLASSLRYWVARKMNEDPGWANLQVIISDASVPGEGEHKIMDHIRRQRVNPAHDPNTKHVIYGLDADLIMLSLATHEPYFKVLREDVFAQAPGGRGCHKCGREGHIAANCIGDAAPPPPKEDMIVKKPQKPEVKPFIFLDVCILREYLEVELALPNLTFPFDLERAIDDWIFLIFFVGNDFLPHLPSLEIREGAIDELLRIWKRELPLLGGYLTSHGKVDLKNIQRVMEGIASLEDDIFRKRRDAEERQDATQKRRRIEDHTRQRAQHASERRARGEAEPDSESMSHGGTDYVAVTVDAKAQDEARKRALAALESGDKGQVIDNQRHIRMANLSAAERLKAEMAGAKAQAARASGPAKEEAEATSSNGAVAADAPAEEPSKTESDVAETSATAATDDAAIFKMDEEAAEATADGEAAPVRSRKRAHDAVAGAITEDGDEKSTDEDDAGDAKDDNEAVDPVVATNFQRKVNPDGTVEYEDTVKLWEPGYRERYYRQKFGVGLDDTDFRRAVVKSYVEGLAWVLAYYYQGCPSWTWYYPYHFSPFAADFVDLETLDITFDVGKPFRPYDQLMGVLPADSRASIPPVFHPLMLEEDSEIIDFYPSEFAIDMNGKKMEWQGVALLPFIDEKRLLAAINKRYPELSEEELRRNAFGDHTLFVSEQHPLYDHLCVLYGKRKSNEPMQLDTKLSGGISGTVKPDPACLPGTTFSSPLTAVGEPDITSDRSISSLYDFPEQTTPHRSVLLKGLRPPPKVLTNEDREWTRAGAPDRGRGRGRGRGGRGSGNMPSHGSMRFGSGPVAAAQNQHARWGSSPSSGYGTPTGYDSPYGSYGSAYGGSSYGAGSGYNSPARAAPPHTQPGMHQAGYGGAGYGGGAPYGGAGYGGGYGGPPPPAQQYGGYGRYGSDAAPPPPAHNGGYEGYGAYGRYGAANGGHAGQGPAHYGNYAAPPPQQQHQQPPAYGGYGGYGQPAAQPFAGQPYAPPPPARGGAPVPLGMRGPPAGRGGGPPGRGGGGGRGRGSSGWGQY